jgi:nucleotide-binding universal stress UspA family protein
MNTILVPTDFSEVSLNAIEYAVQLAQLTEAKIVLLHVYSYPVAPAALPVVMPANEIKNEVTKEFKAIEQAMRNKFGNEILIEHKIVFGSRLEEINLVATEIKADIIIMGAQGAGFISEKIFGSLTSSMLRKANCPLITINAKVKFKQVKNIVFAYDHTTLYKQAIFHSFKKIVHLFGSFVYALNVIHPLRKVEVVNKSVAKANLELALEGIPHSFHFRKSEDVNEGINAFVRRRKINMVVMIPRMHISFKELLSTRNTKGMAFHTRVPLLALHD